MKLRLLTDIVPADQLQTTLKKGVPTKRHEFITKGQTDAFVVFEGEEECPFWRRVGDGIRFVYTDLTYEAALATAGQTNSFLDHVVTETDGGEFLDYYWQAVSKHGRSG